MAKFKGGADHLKRLQRMHKGMPRMVGDIMMELAEEHAREARASIVEGAQPSRPGKPPHNQTGELRESIYAERTGPTSARSVADAPHAVPQEFGTSDFAERPFMRPVANKMRKEAGDIARVKVRRLNRGQAPKD
jgi:HK97 gp10 family phage protein